MGKLFEWFQYSNLKVNASKCCFFISSYKSVTRKTKDSTVSENTKSEKRFAGTIDRET